MRSTHQGRPARFSLGAMATGVAMIGVGLCVVAAPTRQATAGQDDDLPMLAQNQLPGGPVQIVPDGGTITLVPIIPGGAVTAGPPTIQGGTITLVPTVPGGTLTVVPTVPGGTLTVAPPTVPGGTVTLAPPTLQGGTIVLPTRPGQLGGGRGTITVPTPGPGGLIGRPQPLPPDRISPCDTPVLLADVSLSIDPESVGASQRFAGIGEALDALIPGTECGVTILVAPGSYREDLLSIAVHLTLEGLPGARPALLGWIVIDEPVNVTVRNLDIVGVGHRAIDAVNRATALRLFDVSLLSSLDHGVRFGGSRLTAENLLVQATHGVASGSAGIYVFNGSTASLTDVSLWANDGAGLIVDGPGSTVLARRLEIVQTNLPRSWLDECALLDFSFLGALVARNGGTAEIVAELRNNDFVGLQANTAGEIRFLGGVVDATRSLEGTDCAGGLGVTAGNGGRIDLTDFEVSDNGLCGLVVQVGGAIDARNGVVSGSPVGVCVLEPSFDFMARILDHVALVDVGAPLQAVRYAAPGGPESID